MVCPVTFTIHSGNVVYMLYQKEWWSYSTPIKNMAFANPYSLLWSPYGIWQTIIFSSCGFFFLLFFFFAFLA